MKKEPEHMDKWDRNERVFEILKSFGLFVEPVRTKGTNIIYHFIISTGIPDYSQFQGC